MGETEKRCRTCGHWGEWEIEGEGMVCDAIRSDVDGGSAEDPAFISLDSTTEAAFITRPDFGCVLWQARE